MFNHLKIKTMKTNYTTTNSIGDLIANLPETVILNLQEMNSVRGGEGEDDGTVPIIIIPKGIK